MTASHASWRPELISIEAQRLAETASRQAGVPLPLWLARLVRETSAAEGLPSGGRHAPSVTRSLSPRPVPAAARTVLAMLADDLRHDDYPPLDEARTYLRLMTEFDVAPAEITAAVGRSREHVAQALRLLGLPDAVRKLIEQRQLSTGHAYALLETRDPAGLAQAIIAEGLDVEETRRRAAGGLRAR